MEIKHINTGETMVTNLSVRQAQLEIALKQGLEALESNRVNRTTLRAHQELVRSLTADLPLFRGGLESIDENHDMRSQLCASCEGLSELIGKFKKAISNLVKGGAKMEISRNRDELAKYIKTRYLNPAWIDEQKWHSPFANVKAAAFSKYLSIHGEVPDNILAMVRTDSDTIVKHCQDYAKDRTKLCEQLIKLAADTIKAGKQAPDTEAGLQKLADDFVKRFKALNPRSVYDDEFRRFRTHIGISDDLNDVTSYTKKVANGSYGTLTGPSELKAIAKKDVEEVGKLMMYLLDQYWKVVNAFDNKVMKDWVDHMSDEAMEAFDKTFFKVDNSDFAVDNMSAWFEKSGFLHELVLIDAHATVLMKWIEALEQWIGASVKAAA